MLQRPNIITSFLLLTTRRFTLIGATTSLHTTTSSEPSQSALKLLQVQIVHRHGDRTPITPMRNTTFWKQTLPPPSTLQKLSEDIHTLRRDNVTPHAAGGKGPFGQLTSLGLYQMVDLGGRLRAELLASPLFASSSSRRLHPSRIRVTSTDFPRTLQSVTGLLVGLFPDKDPDGTEKITIDARHTDIMIPDPQPRRTKEQEELEKELATAVMETEREKNMRGLAVRVSEVLRRNVLGDGAEDVTFGVGEEKDGDATNEPLPWAQLAEITKCLKVRGMLPPEITAEDQDLISSHAAWRWFETLRHPRLARLAMHGMVEKMIENAHEARTCAAAVGDDGAEEHGTADHALLHIFSAHDSTLIGLMCAFRLEQPAQWPEYGSYLKMELWEESEGRHFVRFSLNGAVLRSYWGVREGEEPVEMIDLERLMMLIDEQDYETEML